MTPNEIIYCIEALAENSPEHISDDAWHEIQELVRDVDFSPVRENPGEFTHWLYKDIFPMDTD